MFVSVSSRERTSPFVGKLSEDPEQLKRQKTLCYCAAPFVVRLAGPIV